RATAGPLGSVEGIGPAECGGPAGRVGAAARAALLAPVVVAVPVAPAQARATTTPTVSRPSTTQPNQSHPLLPRATEYAVTRTRPPTVHVVIAFADPGIPRNLLNGQEDMVVRNRPHR
ncbi:hypothetical protein AB4212_35850, partial [Streptomyces sp. 2MCAF27]